MVYCEDCDKETDVFTSLDIKFNNGRHINGYLCESCCEQYGEEYCLIEEGRVICLIKYECKLPDLDAKDLLFKLPKELNKIILDYLRYDIACFTFMNPETYRQIRSLMYRATKCSLIFNRVIDCNGDTAVEFDELAKRLDKPRNSYPIFNLWNNLLTDNRFVRIINEDVKKFESKLRDILTRSIPKDGDGNYILKDDCTYFEPCDDIFTEVQGKHEEIDKYKSQIKALKKKITNLEAKIETQVESDDYLFAEWKVKKKRKITK